ncbi:Uncharacterised protein [Mycobacteroides abscessus subsp. abscessus]|nr:Uncharacterised protein [Mycobacteroides abscessus subsp. abscessus]
MVNTAAVGYATATNANAAAGMAMPPRLMATVCARSACERARSIIASAIRPASTTPLNRWAPVG